MSTARYVPQLSTTLVTFGDQPPSWETIVATAQAADRAGVDRLLVSDHLAFGEQLDDYARPELGGTAGGRQPTGPDGHWLEPLTVLTAVAAVTDGVRLGTNILLAALRNPLALAKTLATLDVISNGRVDLGVGVGWQRAECEAAGVPFERRGQQLDHTLGVMSTLWRNRVAEFEDDLLSFERIHTMPKPLQPGGVPVWIGGSVNRRVARRIARFGSGWIPWGEAAADVVESIPRMRALVESEGGDLGGVQIASSIRRVASESGGVDLGATMAQVPPLVEAGVTDIRLMLAAHDGAHAIEERYREAVLAFRAVTGG